LEEIFILRLGKKKTRVKTMQPNFGWMIQVIFSLANLKKKIFLKVM
jgi:hypothetical protein